MAAEMGNQISLKLVIDKKNEKVVFAECNGDFVDILFSFLTMPMGTIVRLLNKQPSREAVGCFTSLYCGVTELNDEFFLSEKCKTMLLCPNNPSHTLVKKLKINIDDTKPLAYFTYQQCGHFSVVNNGKCPCGYVMGKPVVFWTASPAFADCGGVFVNPTALFIITDDLQVMPSSYNAISSLIRVLGMNDLNELQQKTVNIGLDQICGLLKVSFLSKSTLTDTFLRDQCIQFNNTDSGPIRFKTESEAASKTTCMSVKLIARKTDKKIICAEANEDFIDLLFSLLTIPAGLVVKLLGGNSSFTCVDNLYKSVGNPGMVINSSAIKQILVSPKLQCGYLCKRPLLEMVDGKSADKFVDLIGYVKRPSTFMVTDDLVVTPFTSFSMICLVRSLNMNISCLEEHVIQALSLLQASLISGSALTTWIASSALIEGFNATLKKPKQESNAP